MNTFSVLKNGKNMQDANYKMMKTNKQLIGIDLFAGAGGLSLGAEMAGISMRYAVEADAYAAASYKRNFNRILRRYKKTFSRQIKYSTCFYHNGRSSMSGVLSFKHKNQRYVKSK